MTLVKRLLILCAIALASSETGAQPYKDTAFSDIFKIWDAETKKEIVGLTVMPPQKLHFSVRYMAAPVACSNGVLGAALSISGFADFLKQAPTGHCIEVAAEDGRTARLYVQDVLVPGLIHDAKLGGKLDLHAVLFGYEVEKDRTRNQPVMMVTEFEPERPRPP